jgi:hypothetical protein
MALNEEFYMKLRYALLSGLLTIVAGACTHASANVIYAVSFNDPDSDFAGLNSQLATTIIQAGNDWSQFLRGVPGQTTTINVLVSSSHTIPRATGRSLSANFAGFTPGGVQLFETGAADLYRTGMLPLGSPPDVDIDLNPDYLHNELSFVPLVPSNKTDALSVFTHELGHAIGFNGYLDSNSGTVPSDANGPYESTYDQFIASTPGGPFFTGPRAEAVYGNLFNAGAPTPVPLTTFAGTEALYHLGNGDINTVTCPTSGLLADLMNGVAFCRGQRYDISPLDLAILADTGLTVVPEPSTWLLVVIGCASLLAYGWQREQAA